ncbi:MAG: hypothetical protein ACI9D0_000482 [Bacteroidia bacterium]|jgi:hypothetical protein
MHHPRSTRRTILAAALGLIAASCATTRDYGDATVIMHTSGGTELGVSTPGGVVFLGNTARSGEVDMTVWFGDGPSIEASIIEPIGDGLFLAEGEIRFPTIEVAFIEPAPGDRIYAKGRHGAETWEVDLFPTKDPRVAGLCFRSSEDLPRDNSQVGAGVYWDDPVTDRPALIGLISGRVVLDDGSEYITAVGSEGLWRLIANRRDVSTEGRWTYREDIL